MLIDILSTMDTSTIPPAVPGDYPICLEVAEDTWCGSSGTFLRTAAARLMPQSQARTHNLPCPTHDLSLLITAPSLTSFMAWMRAFDRGDLVAPPDISASARALLLQFGTLCVLLGRREHDQDNWFATMQPGRRPGDATPEEIEALVGWASRVHPVRRFISGIPICAYHAWQQWHILMQEETQQDRGALTVAQRGGGVYRQAQRMSDGVVRTRLMLAPEYTHAIAVGADEEGTDSDSDIPELVALGESDEEDV